MLTQKYTAIVCMNNKLVIGNEGKQLYYINSDLENFKRLTTDNVVIMGRNTFESIGHPLPGRVNIILTKDPDYKLPVYDNELYDDTYICNSLEEVDDFCYAYFSDKELFVIGGGKIYNEYYQNGLIDKAIVTLVNDDKEGDVLFPDIENDENYKLIFKTMSLRDHPTDTYYRYLVYKKKNVK